MLTVFWLCYFVHAETSRDNDRAKPSVDDGSPATRSGGPVG
jgi:hypothetical protein